MYFELCDLDLTLFERLSKGPMLNIRMPEVTYWEMGFYSTVTVLLLLLSGFLLWFSFFLRHVRIPRALGSLTYVRTWASASGHPCLSAQEPLDRRPCRSVSDLLTLPLRRDR